MLRSNIIVLFMGSWDSNKWRVREVKCIDRWCGQHILTLHSSGGFYDFMLSGSMCILVLESFLSNSLDRKWSGTHHMHRKPQPTNNTLDCLWFPFVLVWRRLWRFGLSWVLLLMITTVMDDMLWDLWRMKWRKRKKIPSCKDNRGFHSHRKRKLENGAHRIKN